MKFLKAFLLLSFCAVQSIVAQDFIINGKVTTEEKIPISNAQILVEPIDQVVTTNNKGEFNITLQTTKKYKLNISHVGFKRIEIFIDDRVNDILQIVLEENIQTLEEVMIKDNFSIQANKSSALNINVVDTDYLQQNRAGSLVETLQQLPGFSTISIGSGQAKPVLRGLSFNRVAIIQNGIKHQAQQWGTDHGLEIDQYSSERIEVVKGPATLMYGSDAIGGVIDIKELNVPKTNSLQGKINFKTALNNLMIGNSINLNGRGNNIFFNTQLTYFSNGDTKLPVDSVSIYSYRIPLYKNRMRNTAGKELNGSLTVGYLNKRIKSTITISNFYQKSGFFANAHGVEPRKVDTKLHDKSNRDIQYPFHQVNHFKIINNTNFFTESHQLKLNVGYQRNYRTERNNYVAHGYMPVKVDDKVIKDDELEREFDKETYSANLLFKWMGEKDIFQSGIQSEYQHNEIGGVSFIMPEYKEVSAGLFLYNRRRLNKTFQLHTGIRYDIGRINIEEYKDWFPSKIKNNETEKIEYLIRASQFEKTFKNFSWSVGLNAEIEPFLLKTNIGKSFRMPIAKELSVNGVNYHSFSYEIGNSNLDSEVSYQWDFTAEINQDKWNLSVSPFFNYFTNYIYLNPTSKHDYLYGAGNQVFEYRQSEVMRLGGEFNLHYSPLDQLKFGVVGEYIYAEQLSGDKKGFTLPFSPPANLLFNVNYVFANRGHLKKSYTGIALSYTFDQKNIVPPEEITEGYTLLYLNLGTTYMWKNQPIELNIKVDNLFNTTYRKHTSFYRLINLPEMGRNVSFILTIPFSVH